VDWSKKKILVTGGNGFLGTSLVKELKNKDANEIVIPSSKKDDLRNLENCRKVVKDIDIVFHLAANVGGIGLHSEKPGDLFYDNLMMGTQLLNESKNEGIEKFIGLGTVTSYPKLSKIPFSEEHIWDGYPDETNAPYGLAKKMLIVQSLSYRKQFNFKSINIIPTNLYGPNDHFNNKKSHVIPSLITKIHNAKINDEKSVEIWGDGTPTRDFMFVDDAARGSVLAAEKYDDVIPLNLGTLEEVSIKHVAETICKLLGYDGELTWDKSKPNGQMRRCVSSKRAKEIINFEPKIGLTEGLKLTTEWYLNNKDT
tara:strand:- start:218 stop:1150 length:933 start_codon:yes stop_codon:yes gene_type:complete